MTTLKLNGNVAMSSEAYHAETSHISKSGLDLINRSPAHYYAAYLDPAREPRKPTDAMVFGLIAHAFILEPATFSQNFIIEPTSAPKRPTSTQLNAKNPAPETVKSIEFWRNFDAQAAGRTIVDAATFKQVQAMRKSIERHPASMAFLHNGVAEQSFFAVEPTTGAKVKIRPDWLSSGYPFICDLKTTEDASPAGFTRSIVNYRYHVQAALYMRIYELATGIVPEGFCFIAVEKLPPYGVAVYYLDAEAMELGRREYMRDLATYVHCLSQNQWPGYGDAVQQLTLPRYAFKH